jgi:Flp pilus assembly protein TadD
MAGRIEAIQKMLRKNPDDTFLHYSLGMEYASAARCQEAMKEFRRCIELDASYLPAYVEAGKALRAAGRFEEARAMFSAGLALAGKKNEGHTQDFIRQQLEALPEGQ